MYCVQNVFLPTKDTHALSKYMHVILIIMNHVQTIKIYGYQYFGSLSDFLLRRTASNPR